MDLIVCKQCLFIFMYRNQDKFHFVNTSLLIPDTIGDGDGRGSGKLLAASCNRVYSMKLLN